VGARLRLAVVLALLALPAGAAAQAGGGAAGGRQVAPAATELERLRHARELEAKGDLAGAERVLGEVLDGAPTSLTALLGLERVLKLSGRLETLVPRIERLLAADRRSSIGWQMLVRTHAALGRTEELERAAEGWVSATPRLETPYREVARVWQARGEPARAVAWLERGRKAVGRKDALAFELGEAAALLGDEARAVREWERAIGKDGSGAQVVRRRIAELPDGGARVLPGLVGALTREPTTLQRRRLAVELAIQGGLGVQAEETARDVAAELNGEAQRAFLVDVARRADGARLHRLAYWAYGEIAARGGPSEQLLAVRSRLAELALVVGDTAGAQESYGILEASYAAGTAERRQAAAARVALAIREAEPAEAVSQLEVYRCEFPEAPELDGLAAAAATRLLEAGDAAAADRVLAGVTGPRSGLVRARMALARGETAQARSALLAAAPRLSGAEATRTIALATLIGRLGADGVQLLGTALDRLSAGGPAGAVAALVDGSGALPAAERAAVLGFAANVAEGAGLAADAERVQRMLIAEHPTAPETPAALLALARTLSGRPDSAAEARALLERLILEHPRSPLVPQARRELERLAGRVPGP